MSEFDIKTAQRNKDGYIETSYDGVRVQVSGNHPHKGATAICLGADRTLIGFGMVFKREDTGETFFVFRPDEVKPL